MKHTSVILLSLVASLSGACTPSNTPDAAADASDASDALNANDSSDANASNDAADAALLDVLADQTSLDASNDSASSDGAAMGDASEGGSFVPIDSGMAALPARCTGPYREVERGTFVDDMPMITGPYIGNMLFDGASLWFTFERTDNTGTGSYDPRVFESRGWGSTVTTARASATLPTRNGSRTVFALSNVGAPFVWLSGPHDLRTGGALQLGPSIAAPWTTAILPTETWVVSQDSMGASREIVRYAPMTIAPAPAPARLGASALPALPAGQLLMFRTPDGSGLFVGAGATNATARYVALDSALRTVGSMSQPADLRESPKVANHGLWFVNRPSPGVVDLRRFTPDGRDLVVASYAERLGTARVASLSDDMVALVGGAELRLIDPSTGNVMQTIPDAYSAEISGSSLFVIGHNSGNEYSVRRMSCN